MHIAILGTSQKENERRHPLHPAHFVEIAPALRRQMIFEQGYGEPFGVSDAEIVADFAGVAPRDALLQESDLVVSLKPTNEEAAALKDGATLWGWIHCVQNPAITQLAIDKRLTYIAWEAMNQWDVHGHFQSHIFSANNRIAGYAGVLHAVTLRGLEGFYGPPQKVVLINTGQVSRGAMRALHSQGFTDIHVVSVQPRAAQEAIFQRAAFYQLQQDEESGSLQIQREGVTSPLVQLLQEADIIINGIFQNPLQPLMFLQPGEEDLLKPGCLVIDISCDTAMGFPFARATSFEAPLLELGNIFYYAVDHTPSLLWQSATWAISQALLPFLDAVISGGQAIRENSILRKAIEIDRGHIRNQEILQFQSRAASFPHAVKINSSSPWHNIFPCPLLRRNSPPSRRTTTN